MKSATLPKTEESLILKTEKGIPETIAEMYEGSSKLNLETKSYSLFVFDIGKMDLVHKNKHNRFGYSYRFISRTPKEMKSEIEEIAEKRYIILRFQEPLPDIYGAALKDGTLLDVREILGDLEKKYS